MFYTEEYKRKYGTFPGHKPEISLPLDPAANMDEIMVLAEERFGLTDADQDNELFYTEAIRRLGDEFSRMGGKFLGGM